MDSYKIGFLSNIQLINVIVNFCQGVLFDHFKNHKYGFGLAGGMIAVSGLMLFLIPLLQRTKADNEDNASKATEEQALSSGKQSTLCVDISGTTTIKTECNSNGVCNGVTTPVRTSDRNFNEV